MHSLSQVNCGDSSGVTVIKNDDFGGQYVTAWDQLLKIRLHLPLNEESEVGEMSGLERLQEEEKEKTESRFSSWASRWSQRKPTIVLVQFEHFKRRTDIC